MTIAETLLVFLGIPLGIYVLIAGYSLLTSKRRPRYAEYRLGAPWNHSPVLWTAADEVAASAGHAHGHAAIEAAGAELIGGRASGRF